VTAVAGLVLTHHGQPPSPGRQIAVAAGVRNEVAVWVHDQVGGSVDIACDAVMCADLQQHGVPAGNLNVLGQNAPDPYGSQLVIATADIRSQFGTKLTAVYAPQVLITFGTGTSQAQVRVIAANGPAAFRQEVDADLQARKSSGSQLAGNQRVVTSIQAKAELATGQVDLRLITTLAFVAGQQPIDIIGFGTYAPSASRDVPLRTAYLAAVDPASKLTGSAYTSALVKALHAQVPPYVPLTVTTADYAGQQVLEVVFSAPSPLGLLRG
jgi:hypothetical protein